jgi:ferritin-like metal-binding protein YciE
MAKITDPAQAFSMKLAELYDIEKALEKALPKMAKAATDPRLKEGFKNHLEETKEQSKRLERAFKILGSKAKKSKSEGIRGIIADGEHVASLKAADSIHNAMMAGAARSVEHFEIACYMGAIEQAKALGYDDIEGLLRETLDEEQVTDEKLAEVSEECLAMEPM